MDDAGKIDKTALYQSAAANEARLAARGLGWRVSELDAYLERGIHPREVLRSMRKEALELIQHIDCALGELE